MEYLLFRPTLEHLQAYNTLRAGPEIHYFDQHRNTLLCTIPCVQAQKFTQRARQLTFCEEMNPTSPVDAVEAEAIGQLRGGGGGDRRERVRRVGVALVELAPTLGGSNDHAQNELEQLLEQLKKLVAIEVRVEGRSVLRLLTHRYRGTTCRVPSAFGIAPQLRRSSFLFLRAVCDRAM